MAAPIVIVPNDVQATPVWIVKQCKSNAATAQETLIPTNQRMYEQYGASWSVANCTHYNQPLDLLSLLFYTTCMSIWITSSYSVNNFRKTIEMQLSCGKERVTLSFTLDEEHLCVDVAVEGVFLDYFDCGLLRSLRQGSSYTLAVREGHSMDIAQVCGDERFYNSKLALKRVNRSIGIEETCTCGNVSSFRDFWKHIKQCSRGPHRGVVYGADRYLLTLIELVIIVILIIVVVNFLGC